MDECPVCRIPLDYAARERCPSSGCPCYGTVIGSAEMERAARRSVTRPFSRRGADPHALLDALGDRAIDGGRRMAEARAFGAQRAARVDRPNLTAYEALAALGIATVGHEPGWPG